MTKIFNLIIGLLIFFSVFILIYFSQSYEEAKNLETELQKFDKSSPSNVIEISNPVFKSKGLDSNSYVIKARKGLQDESDIELFNIDAEFMGEDNKLFFVSADRGFYRQKNETIELSENVIIVDELNNRTSASNAIIDVNIKKITLFDEVISVTNSSSISSKKSIVDKIENTITYSGNVVVKIEDK